MGKARRAILLVAAGMSCTLASMAVTPMAVASFEFKDVWVSISKVDGSPERAAGSHPDLTLLTEFSNEGGQVHDILLALPPGFVGNPTTTATCDPAVFHPPFGNHASCPVASQIGTVNGESSGLAGFLWNEPVFNLSHGPTVPARFGFSHLGVNIYIDATVRPDDYGVTSGSRGTIQTERVSHAEVQIWGVPQDPAHDPFRISSQYPLGGAPTEVSPKPFLRTPTSCSEEPVTFQAETDSWEEQGLFDVVPLTEDAEGNALSFERCENLPFAPKLTASTTSAAADSPSGLAVDIDVPQNEAPYGQSTSDVRKVVTTFPEGMTVSDSSAAGLGSCSQQQIGIGSNDAPTCPDSSKLGTVKVDTPLLEEQLEGNLYLAKQTDNPFGSLLAIYMAVEGPGFYLKLPGKVDLDPATGQLTTTFSDTPQLPFEHLRLELRSGARAPLTTPRECGTYAVKSEFVPWSGTAPVLGESKFTVSENCAAGFAPKLRAGTGNPTGGSFSPFTLQITRQDGEPNLSKIQATLPEGLLAKLAGVPLCGDAQATTGDCPAGSQVGKVTVGAGAGPSPLYVPEAGKAPTAAYLAGPYKGAPYSMVVKVPAQAGPFDLGTVTVRNALNIDPTTTQVTASSDPLPQILQGIPIAYRDVRVEVNRPEFTINPTSCKAKEITTVLTSASGQTATPSAGFKATDCGELGFGPSLRISLKGKMKRTGNPALTAVLKAPKGDANLAKTTVILPGSEFIDNAHISNPCTRVQFNASACPASSILGTATATSPLVDQPLSGPVYFRSNGGERELPDLVADLNGPIHVTVVGFIDSVKGRVRTRFQNIPDAPVSKFVLKMKGGSKGLLENSENLCSFTPKAKVQMTGQNGKTASSSLKLGTSCGKSKGTK